MNPRSLLSACLIVCFFQLPLSADDWPQWRGPTRDGVWRESGIIEKFNGPEIERRWSAEISGGYSGPTVADGRVYLTDRIAEPQQLERVLCFDWATGKKLWSYSYPCEYRISYRAGPRASVTVDQGRAYALGAMGHFLCLDAASGEVLWKKDPVVDFKIRVPIWGVAAAPLVEGDLVVLHIGGGDGACVVALDKRTGRRRWNALDDPASYSAPIVIDQGGRRVVVCWTASRIAGLDAGTGRLYWQYPYRFRRWVDGIITPVLCSNHRLFISSFTEGSLMLRLGRDAPRVEKLWRRGGRDERNTDALHSLIGNPCITDDYIYGVDSYGEFRCLDAGNGDRIWEDLTITSQTRWGTVHMVRNGEKIWVFNDTGELIISRLSPQGFQQISRAKLIDPTRKQLNRRNGVTWSHPAYAYRHVFARNDQELICASLAAEQE